MLGRKNDKSKKGEFRDGIVGKYKKVDKPLNVPIINVWTSSNCKTAKKGKEATSGSDQSKDNHHLVYPNDFLGPVGQTGRHRNLKASTSNRSGQFPISTQPGLTLTEKCARANYSMSCYDRSQFSVDSLPTHYQSQQHFSTHDYQNYQSADHHHYQTISDAKAKLSSKRVLTTQVSNSSDGSLSSINHYENVSTQLPYSASSSNCNFSNAHQLQIVSARSGGAFGVRPGLTLAEKCARSSASSCPQLTADGRVLGLNEAAANYQPHHVQIHAAQSFNTHYQKPIRPVLKRVHISDSNPDTLAIGLGDHNGRVIASRLVIRGANGLSQVNGAPAMTLSERCAKSSAGSCPQLHVHRLPVGPTPLDQRPPDLLPRGSQPNLPFNRQCHQPKPDASSCPQLNGELNQPFTIANYIQTQSSSGIVSHLAASNHRYANAETLLSSVAHFSQHAQADPLMPRHQPKQCIVPANPYLTRAIPQWLFIYSQAPIEYDQNMKWDVFDLPDLDCYQAMMNRLFRQEAEEVVMGYEAYRATLQREIESRLIELNQIQYV